jgi:hypothetical protein
MKRREFIAGLGSAVVYSAEARSQQTTPPMVGFLSGGQEVKLRSLDRAFQQGLSEQGYVQGRNVEILHRWAENRYDRLPARQQTWFASEWLRLLPPPPVRPPRWQQSRQLRRLP